MSRFSSGLPFRSTFTKMIMSPAKQGQCVVLSREEMTRHPDQFACINITFYDKADSQAGLSVNKGDDVPKRNATHTVLLNHRPCGVALSPVYDPTYQGKKDDFTEAHLLPLSEYLPVLAALYEEPVLANICFRRLSAARRPPLRARRVHWQMGSNTVNLSPWVRQTQKNPDRSYGHPKKFKIAYFWVI